MDVNFEVLVALKRGANNNFGEVLSKSLKVVV